MVEGGMMKPERLARMGKEMTEEVFERILAARKLRDQEPEPTEEAPEPTPEEMASWHPPVDDSGCCADTLVRAEVNVTTGELKRFELSLDEYRQHHVERIRGMNRFVRRKAARVRKDHEERQMARLREALAKDPELLDRIVKGK
jgi:hypothetical protein